MKKRKLAVLVSGTGSLLKAALEDGLQVDLVIADKPCPGIDEVPRGYEHVKIKLISRKDFRNESGEFDRIAFTQAVLDFLNLNEIDVVAMAGFMTIFSSQMFLPKAQGGFDGRILNIHPALLPAFKGEKAVKDALEYGVKVTGTTIHIATYDLDAGPIIAQEAVNVFEDDTVETLHERIKQVERVLYPRTIRKFMEDLTD